MGMTMMLMEFKNMTLRILVTWCTDYSMTTIIKACFQDESIRPIMKEIVDFLNEEIHVFKYEETHKQIENKYPRHHHEQHMKRPRHEDEQLNERNKQGDDSRLS
uniref:Uncharacterized protein n=1 Tax=Meloidogyne javanica TaxID=6303 RepID=A0A915N481_MELJA